MTENFSAEKRLQSELSQELPFACPPQPVSPAVYPDDDLNRQSLKQHMEQFQGWLADAFNAGLRAEELVDARAHYIDQLLQRLWTFYGFDNIPETAMVAVGGYGRGELHPLSDIDVLVLKQAGVAPASAQPAAPATTDASAGKPIALKLGLSAN